MSDVSASPTVELPLGDARLQSWAARVGAEAYAQYRVSNSVAQWAMYHEELLRGDPSAEQCMWLCKSVVTAMVLVGVVVALLI